MTATHTGRATFIVTDHGGDWTVDLLRNKCVGQCDCWKFKRDLKAVADGDKKIEECRCPHIEHAGKELLRMFLHQLAKQFPDNTDVA